MKAVRLVRLGNPLEEAEVELPEIGASDVLIRVEAAGVCHSDAHYRAGVSRVEHLPITPGHEVAGRIEAVGMEVSSVAPGDRVAVQYLVHCGRCAFCRQGNEQFCSEVQMLGKDRDGGYAEFVAVPAVNAFRLPETVSFGIGAVMMCSSATALHALRKSRLKPDESVAIFGFGGLGFSALQLAQTLGAAAVYVVEINPAKLALIPEFGGIAINARAGDPVEQIRDGTQGKGVDVSIELIGSAATMRQAVQCLRPLGRATLVALTTETLSIRPYPDLIGREAEIIGVSDHLASEIPILLDLADKQKLRFPTGTLRSVDLAADQINTALDALEKSSEHIRTVITP